MGEMFVERPSQARICALVWCGLLLPCGLLAQTTISPSFVFANDPNQPPEPAGLAFDGTYYWSVSGNSTTGLRLAQYSAAGAFIADYSPGLDFRSVFAAGPGIIMARQFSSPIIYKQTSPGAFTAITSLVGGSLNSQSQVVLNGLGTEFIARNGAVVTRWDLSGNLIGTVPLHGYGNVPGENFYPANRGIASIATCWFTYSNSVVSAWSFSGVRLFTAMLSGAGDTFEANFSYSFTNGLFFVESGGNWRGYPVSVPPQWISLAPSGTPPSPRADASAALVNGNELIVFGGNPGTCDAVTASLNDTWALSGANGLKGTGSWTQLLFPPGSSPPARRGHSAVYNSSSDRMVVFGGDAFGCSSQKFNDLWVLGNASGSGGTPAWQQLSPAGTTPPARSEHVATYNPATNQMLVFGGSSATASLTDLWLLTNADGTGGTPQWAQLNPSGTGPTATSYMAGTYDSLHDRLTLFAGWSCCAGPAVNSVWLLLNAAGVGGTPQWSSVAAGGTPPSARVGPRGSENPAANRALYFGGSGMNDVWFLLGANGLGTPSWQPLVPSGAAPSGRGGVVANPAAAVDVISQRVILFGGKGSGGALNDTWVLAP